MSMGEEINLGPFLEEMDSLLGDLSATEIRRRIMAHARHLSASERDIFLSIFRSPPPQEETQEVPRTPTDNERLIEDIEDFVTDLEDGVYYEGYGWDHELGTEHAFGDESWVWEMDELFLWSGEEFLAGNLESAARAYGKLLRTFHLGEEVGHFCGPELPEEMLETDIGEAKARYLRCVYELSSPQERPEQLYEETKELRYIGRSDMGLEEIRQADIGELTEFESFLEKWIELLERKQAETPPFEKTLPDRLLREATNLVGGTEGLAQLAREQGDSHPSAYHEWVAELARRDDISGCIEAAREGVERIADPREKAKLADYLAQLAEDTGDGELELEAWRRAFRTCPSPPRFFALWNSCKRLGRDISEEMETEIQEVDLRGDYGVTDARLAAMLELTAGTYRSAVRRAAEAEPLGWSNRNHPGPVVFPFLLLAATGRTEAPDESCIQQLVQNIAWSPVGYWRPPHPFPDMREVGGRTSFKDVLVDTLSRRPPDEKERQQYRETARSIARNRMRAIVSNTHRKAYRRAAMVTVAVAEAVCLLEGEGPGIALVEQAREEFPRHSAFRRELNDLIASSPVLPDVRV